MRKILFVLLLFAPSFVFAKTLLFTWTPPTTNEDGTELTDLAGYKLYQSEASGVYGTTFVLIENKDAKEYTLNNVAADKPYYYVMTAYDTSGNESEHSNEVKVDHGAPGAPYVTITVIINK